ncbi:MAG: hypothetical protein JNM93_10200 [Bacteriovoracaceae bacterium]|nr:hypothetical protein [Bacteriovoracaceae bacterium]
MENVIYKMDQHLDLLNKSLELTEKMLADANTENINGIEADAQNRERLLNIIATLQTEIENELKACQPEKTLNMKVQNWVSRTQICVEQIFQVDQKLLDTLHAIKDKTHQEIGVVHKQKQGVKGYNLNNVKR